ncbi:MAG: hypothetical protein ACLPN5_21185 [Roseiarcus sp.]
MQVADGEALTLGDRIGEFELFEIVSRARTLIYRFRSKTASFGLEWPRRAEPATRAGFAFVAAAR